MQEPTKLPVSREHMRCPTAKDILTFIPASGWPGKGHLTLGSDMPQGKKKKKEIRKLDRKPLGEGD